VSRAATCAPDSHAGFDVAPSDSRGWLNDRPTPQLPSADPAIATFPTTMTITLPGFVLMNLLAGFAGLLRVKGIVNVEGGLTQQAVQTIVSEPVPLAEWRKMIWRCGSCSSRAVLMQTTSGALSNLRFERPRPQIQSIRRPTHFRNTIELFRTSHPAGKQE
jgi:hypothetical protein